ncbi:MAG: hypothetical protein BWK76_14670 [Desulfobulbaceae bacterium A2]|nr:MAG: hypothetical protein BWK76_14670 [Desulfobulbaceae bacterium A2]
MRAKVVFAGLLLLSSVWLSGCAYRYYLGMHGPSIRAFADVHQGAAQDKQCLECHDPKGDLSGPPSPHPQFTGCLKCHNDPL